MAFDSDSTKFLDEVKKGKPRRFAMVFKGEKIVSLVVYKKGSLEKYKKQAREEGKGQFFHGVIDGKGQNIVFKLCRADGFEEPPGKEMKLKQYLKEVAGVQFKPTYQIVDELPAFSDSDDDSPIGAGENTGQSRTEASKDVNEGALAEKLTAAVGKMLPAIKQALEADPTRKAELLQPVADIKALIAEGRLDEAKTALLQYGQQLKGSAKGVSNKGTKGPLVACRAARLQWDITRKSVLAELEKLELSIVSTFASLKNFPRHQLVPLTAGTSELYTILDELDQRLIDKLDDALNATADDDRNGHLQEAGKLIQQHQAFVNSSPLVQAIEKNPFSQVNVRGRLLDTLEELASTLA